MPAKASSMDKRTRQTEPRIQKTSKPASPAGVKHLTEPSVASGAEAFKSMAGAQEVSAAGRHTDGELGTLCIRRRCLTAQTTIRHVATYDAERFSGSRCSLGAVWGGKLGSVAAGGGCTDDRLWAVDVVERAADWSGR